MSDLKLFRIAGSSVTEIPGTSAALERSLQRQIEQNLESFLGVRFLASEFSTGQSHGGRMDTLGVDENGFPVIVEYKRSSNENVINQGLFYLDWLMDHRGDFEILVTDKYGREAARAVDWSSPRLLCIAGDFNRYDEHAVNQMNRNIELIRYKLYGDDLLLLELVNAVSARETTVDIDKRGEPARHNGRDRTASGNLEAASGELRDLYESLKSYILALGDDVQTKTLKNYFAFKRIKNFACVEVHNRRKNLLVYVKVNPDTVALEAGFTRDVRGIGHFGTGDLEIRLADRRDFDRAKPLIDASYDQS